MYTFIKLNYKLLINLPKPNLFITFFYMILYIENRIN